jgi:hypothetical protein
VTQPGIRSALPLLLITVFVSGARAMQSPPAGTAAPPKAGNSVNHDAQLLVEFKDRVNRYVELRNKAAGAVPPLKKTDDAADISLAQSALAGKIRSARAGAKPGDIFTPEIANHFRRLLRPETKEPETKASIKDDNPGVVPFKVNEPYPEKATLSTVPPNVLEALPKLPDNIEYRFVGKHLILRDARANLIIDYMLNAID